MKREAIEFDETVLPMAVPLPFGHFQIFLITNEVASYDPVKQSKAINGFQGKFGKAKWHCLVIEYLHNSEFCS